MNFNCKTNIDTIRLSSNSSVPMIALIKQMIFYWVWTKRILVIFPLECCFLVNWKRWRRNFQQKKKFNGKLKKKCEQKTEDISYKEMKNFDRKQSICLWKSSCMDQLMTMLFISHARIWLKGITIQPMKLAVGLELIPVYRIKPQAKKGNQVHLNPFELLWISENAMKMDKQKKWEIERDKMK